jgi:hypothetical protein
MAAKFAPMPSLRPVSLTRARGGRLHEMTPAPMVFEAALRRVGWQRLLPTGVAVSAPEAMRHPDQLHSHRNAVDLDGLM